MATTKKAQYTPVSRESLYSPEVFDHEAFMQRIKDLEPEGWSEVLVEDAGFEPLDVKLYKMYQAGIRSQLNVEDLTMQDLRDIYLAPDFSVDPDDDLEEIALKAAAQAEFMQQLRVLRSGSDKSDDAVNLSKADLREEIVSALDERLTSVRGDTDVSKVNEQAEK